MAEQSKVSQIQEVGVSQIQEIAVSQTQEIAVSQIQGIGQIAFPVGDLGKAKDFYRDMLGFEFLFDAGTMAFFQCGSVRLMLGQSEKQAASEGTIVYFRVSDIDAISSSLEARGVQFLQKPHLVARLKSHDLWIAFLKDPAGNTLGLMSEIARTASKSER